MPASTLSRSRMLSTGLLRGRVKAGGRTLLLRLEGFNLFNHGNMLGRAQTTYGDTGVVIDRGPGRLVAAPRREGDRGDGGQQRERRPDPCHHEQPTYAAHPRTRDRVRRSSHREDGVRDRG